MILNLALWFGLHVVFEKVIQQSLGPLRLYVPVWSSVEFAAIILSASAMIAMLRFKLGMIPTLAASTVFGTVAFYFGF